MDIVEELKATIADIRDWNGDAMKSWDQTAKLIRNGNKTDFPRQIYENTISGYMETMIKAATEIERLRGVEASFLDLMKENIRLREELKKMENLADGYIDEGLTWSDIGMREGE